MFIIILGYILIFVNPGREFNSLRSTLAPFFVTKKSTRASPLQLSVLYVLRASARTSFSFSSLSRAGIYVAESNFSGVLDVSGDWKSAFEKVLLKECGVKPDHYENLGNGIYEVYVEKDGKVIPYAILDSETGEYHG